MKGILIDYYIDYLRRLLIDGEEAIKQYSCSKVWIMKCTNMEV